MFSIRRQREEVAPALTHLQEKQAELHEHRNKKVVPLQARRSANIDRYRDAEAPIREKASREAALAALIERRADVMAGVVDDDIGVLDERIAAEQQQLAAIFFRAQAAERACAKIKAAIDDDERALGELVRAGLRLEHAVLLARLGEHAARFTAARDAYLAEHMVVAALAMAADGLAAKSPGLRFVGDARLQSIELPLPAHEAYTHLHVWFELGTRAQQRATEIIAELGAA